MAIVTEAMQKQIRKDRKKVVKLATADSIRSYMRSKQDIHEAQLIHLINKKMHEAALYGKRKVIVEAFMHENVEHELKANGFTVEIKRANLIDGFGDITTISW